MNFTVSSFVMSIYLSIVVIIIQFLKPFVFDAALTNPLDVARRDYMEYFIDKILEYIGNLKKKTEIEFLVSWLGYAQEHNSGLRDSSNSMLT